jgi:hypothetical protein
MVVLGGFAGLVFDGGMLYYEKRRMQSAADAGAMGGAWEIVRGNTNLGADIRPAALNDTTHNGYSDDPPGNAEWWAQATITVNNPPASGPNAGNARFVEVIIDRPLSVSFMRLLGFSEATVRARGVAGAVNIGDACVIALNRTAGAALNIRGNANIFADCGAMSNSNAANGFQTEGSGDSTFSWAGVTGGYVDNGGSGSMSPLPKEGVPPIYDPLSHLQPPDYSGWPSGYYDASTMTYKCPGGQCVFDAKLEVGGPPGVKTFEPGTYVLRGGMEIQSSNVVTGTDVTFYNTGEGGFGFRTAGTSQVSFTAPTTGDYKGVLMYTNPSAPYFLNELGRGDTTFTWRGAIYTPSQGLSIEGNPQGVNPWALMVADTIDFAGDAGVTFNAPPTDEAPEMLRVAMAE